jgi:phage terminase small subunit
MKLTPKQDLFIQYYMISLNATDSYKKAGYTSKNDKVACISALRLLGNDRIKAIIDERIQQKASANGITADYVLLGIKAIADKQGIKENDTLKAYELLGKHLKLFTEKIESENVNINHEVSSLTDEELEKEIEIERNKLK